MVVRKLPDELPNDARARLFDVMGECRKAVTDAMSLVKPFSLTYRTLSLLTGAIDTVALFFTGSASYFHLMRMPAPDDIEPPG